MTPGIYAAEEGKILHKDNDPKIYISTPFERGNKKVLEYRSKVDELVKLIAGEGTALSGIKPQTHGYTRQTPERVGKQPLLGKVIVEYDNNEVADLEKSPANQQSIYRVWLEREPHAVTWDSTNEQKGGDSCPAGNQKRDGSCSSSTAPASSSSTSAETAHDGEGTVTSSLQTTLVTTNGSSTAPSATTTDPATTSTIEAASETSGAPSCSPTTGNKVSQSEAQEKFDIFCSDLQDLAGPESSETDDTDSFLLASEGSTSSKILTSVANLYYVSAGSVAFNVTLKSGNSYRVDKDECQGAFGTVLNGCAPTSAEDGKTLYKYGGSVPAEDDDGDEVLYSMVVYSAAAIG